jgi:hypothetical protein
MIIRFEHDLIMALYRVSDGMVSMAGEEPEGKTFVVMTEDGAVKVKGTPKEMPAAPDVSEVPEWLQVALGKGNHVSMPREDFTELPESIKQYATVVRN